ncbi:MAG: DUF4912 domain-containing protein [Bacillota bacterium]|nr:DUF4912 domain-containing protein [Bacillota bacterium]
MLVFIIFVLLLAIAGYYAFRYVDRTPIQKKITGKPDFGFEFNEELEPENLELARKHELYDHDPYKIEGRFAQWEDDPPIYLNANEPAIHVLMKDPKWLYCYWHWGHDAKARFEDKFGKDAWADSQPFIRYHEAESGYTADTHINDFDDSWYFRVHNPNSSVRLYLGRIFRGEFVTIAASNLLVIPLGGLSPNIDPNWQPIHELYTENLTSISSAELMQKKREDA